MNSVGSTAASKPKKKSLMSKLMSRKPSSAAAAATGAEAGADTDRDLVRRLSPARLARAETTGDNPGPDSKQIRELKNCALSIVVVGASGDLKEENVPGAVRSLHRRFPPHARVYRRLRPT